MIPPTGGPEDLSGPKLKSSIPAQGQTNYTSNTITLIFDEDINASTLKEQILITPIPQKDIEVKYQKKTVILKLPETLPNTTYNISFGNGIKDITKNNPTNNLKLSFSTGAFIDSLTLKGIVLDAYTNKPLSGNTLSLYNASDTFTVLKHKPLYVTKSSTDGTFNFSNIKEGKYNIYALDDKNKNYIYDLGKEAIAFQKDIELNQNISTLKLRSTSYTSTALKLSRPRNEESQILLSFNRGLQSLEITSSEELNYIPNAKRNEYRVYTNNFPEDSILLTVKAVDSLNNTLNQEIKVKFNANYTGKPSPLLLQIKTDYENKYDPANPQLTLEFNKPLSSSIDTNKISLKHKNKSLAYTIAINNNILTLNPSKAKTYDTLQLELKDSALRAATKQYTSRIKSTFTARKIEDYGNIEGKIETDSNTNFIVQLVNEKKQIVKEIRNTQNFAFTELIPGNYQLIAILDINNNGQWDRGDMDNNVGPEYIIYMDKPILVRANWDIKEIVFNIKPRDK